MRLCVEIEKQMGRLFWVVVSAVLHRRLNNINIRLRMLTHADTLTISALEIFVQSLVV